MKLSFGKILKTAKSIYHPKENYLDNIKCKNVSCRELFKKFNKLPLASEFLLSLLTSILDNIEKLNTNSDIHSLNTKNQYDLHMPNANLSSYQKGVYYMQESSYSVFFYLALKLLNHDLKVLKPTLKDYLLSHFLKIFKYYQFLQGLIFT
jgi:hypothetical protein